MILRELQYTSKTLNMMSAILNSFWIVRPFLLSFCTVWQRCIEEVVVWGHGDLVCTSTNRPYTPCHWKSAGCSCTQTFAPTNTCWWVERWRWQKVGRNRWVASNVEVEGFKPSITVLFGHSWYYSWHRLYTLLVSKRREDPRAQYATHRLH